MRSSDWSSDVCSSDLAEAFHVKFERGLHVEVGDFKRGVMNLAFAKRPGAGHFVLIDIDVKPLGRTAIAESVALVISVASLGIQVPGIEHDGVHLLIALAGGRPALIAPQRALLVHIWNVATPSQS